MPQNNILTVPNAAHSPYLPDTPYLNQAYTIAMVTRKIAEAESSPRVPDNQEQISNLALAVQISLGGATKALFSTNLSGSD